jgi:uncharacterized protein (TIGR02246 family)
MAALEGVEALYGSLIDAWNQQDADGFGGLFTSDGSMVGFDGTSIETPDHITDHLGSIFADHRTAIYVVKVRDVRQLGSSGALLRAVAGMVPPGDDDLKSEVNAIHALVAVNGADGWRIAHFQNTPAAFDGRPDAVRKLTDELRAVLRESR